MRVEATQNARTPLDRSRAPAPTATLKTPSFRAWTWTSARRGRPVAIWEKRAWTCRAGSSAAAGKGSRGTRPRTSALMSTSARWEPSARKTSRATTTTAATSNSDDFFVMFDVQCFLLLICEQMHVQTGFRLGVQEKQMRRHWRVWRKTPGERRL